MAVLTKRIKLQSRGHDDVVDITDRVAEAVSSSKMSGGTATVFVIGSTASVTTIEHEPGLVKDVGVLLEKLVPSRTEWAHNATWGDGNGHSHLKAAVIGPSLSIPFADGDLVLGTWQQIVLIDHDVRPRSRELVVQIVGD